MSYDNAPVVQRRVNARARVILELALRGAILVVVARRHPFSYDVHGYWSRMHHASLHHMPYRDFLWEFPPLTVLVVLPARWLSQTAFTAVFAGEMICAEYGTLLLLRRRFPARAGAITKYWSWVALPLAAQAWFRLDFLSVVLATWALLSILDRRSGAAAIALGFLAKLWPAVLGVVLVAQRRYRQAGVAVAAAAASLALWFAFSPSGFGDFLRYRHGSGLQIESLVGAPVFAAGARVSSASDSYVVLAGRFGWLDAVLLATFCVFVLLCVLALRRRRVEIQPAPFAAALVIALMVCSRILSPQYLVWALPFVSLTWAGGERQGAVLFGVAAWLTAVLNWGYADFVAGDTRLQAAVVVRNLLLIASAALFLRAAIRPGEAVPLDEELVGAR